MNKIKKLIIKYKELITYFIFGVLTTLVNWAVYTALVFVLPDSIQEGVKITVSNAVAWVAGVIFAFITNKHYVFESKTTGKTAYFLEFFKFVFYRVLSFGMDIGSLALLVEVFKINEYLAKIIGQVLVVILNYVFSKLLIFNQQKK